jgi:hypothetical protein
MSDRRAARGPGGIAHALPEYLTWQGADDPRWWASDTPPHGLERFHAHRRHREARRAFLESVAVRPHGVSEIEFQQAHRFSETGGDPQA